MAAPQLETQPCLWQKITFLLLVFLNSRGTETQGKAMALLPVNLSLCTARNFPSELGGALEAEQKLSSCCP